VVFSASLNNLVTHPNLYGWNWDYALLSGFAGDEDLPAQQSASLLAHDHDVSAASGIYFATAKIDGMSFPIIGASLHAAVAPPLLSGHGLQQPNEIVLGGETMARVGKHLGDTVDLSTGHGKSIRLTIVGTATLPALVGPGMGVGAVIDYRLIPPSFRNTQGSSVPGPNAYLIRTSGPPAQALRSLEAVSSTINSPNSPSPGSAGGVIAALRPEEIVDSHSIVAIPAVLGASLAIGAALALGTTLVASVRRRRRDLAVLKTLGLAGRQLGTIVAWQSSITVAIGTLIGVPLGLVLGHVLWNSFADAIYAVPVTSIPPIYVAAIAVGAVVLANIVAAVPARLAARTPTAVLLRTE
jgi:putative ABC transport system permease protein